MDRERPDSNDSSRRQCRLLRNGTPRTQTTGGGNPRLVSTLHAGVYSRTSRPPHRPPPSGALVSEEQFCELLLIPC